MWENAIQNISSMVSMSLWVNLYPRIVWARIQCSIPNWNKSEQPGTLEDEHKNRGKSKNHKWLVASNRIGHWSMVLSLMLAFFKIEAVKNIAEAINWSDRALKTLRVSQKLFRSFFPNIIFGWQPEICSARLCPTSTWNESCATATPWKEDGWKKMRVDLEKFWRALDCQIMKLLHQIIKLLETLGLKDFSCCVCWCTLLFTFVFLCENLHVLVCNGPRTLLVKERFETVSKSKRKRKTEHN